MKLFKISFTLITLLLIMGTVEAQDTIKKPNKSNKVNSINIEVDALSGAFSYNRKFKDQFNLGIGLKIGQSINLSYTESDFYQYNEILGVFLFNRFKISDVFKVDAGFRASYAQLEDYNTDHGFSHVIFIGIYATPMITVWKNFQLGTTLGLGWKGGFISYISLPVIRYNYRF